LITAPFALSVTAAGGEVEGCLFVSGLLTPPKPPTTGLRHGMRHGQKTSHSQRKEKVPDTFFSLDGKI
jgi:hypothetical protein